MNKIVSMFCLVLFFKKQNIICNCTFPKGIFFLCEIHFVIRSQQIQTKCSRTEMAMISYPLMGHSNGSTKHSDPKRCGREVTRHSAPSTWWAQKCRGKVFLVSNFPYNPYVPSRNSHILDIVHHRGAWAAGSRWEGGKPQEGCWHKPRRAGGRVGSNRKEWADVASCRGESERMGSQGRGWAGFASRGGGGQESGKPWEEVGGGNLLPNCFKMIQDLQNRGGSDGGDSSWVKFGSVQITSNLNPAEFHWLAHPYSSGSMK